MLKAFLRIAVFSSHPVPPSSANARMYVVPIVSLFAVRSRIRAQSRHVRIALHISLFQLILFRSRWTANILAQNGTSIRSVLSVLLCVGTFHAGVSIVDVSEWCSFGDPCQAVCERRKIALCAHTQWMRNVRWTRNEIGRNREEAEWTSRDEKSIAHLIRME